MSNLPDIDKLGRLLAEIAELTKQADVIKSQLKVLGDGNYEALVFRASVSTSERSTLDMEAVRAHLSRQFIQANSKVTETTTVRVVARNGKAVKEAA
jgi:hypothetical protein